MGDCRNNYSNCACLTENVSCRHAFDNCGCDDQIGAPTDLDTRIAEVREAAVSNLRAIGALDALREMTSVNVGATLGREQVAELVQYVDALLAALEERTELLEKADRHLWNRHACDFIRDGLIKVPDDL